MSKNGIIFKFFKNNLIVGSGCEVGVISFTYRSYSDWIRGFRRSSHNIVFENMIFLNGVEFRPITSVRDLRGRRFDHIIEMDNAVMNRQYEVIKVFSPYALKNINRV
jgi:hypothetical protein